MENISKQKKKRPGMVQGPGWSAQRPGDMKKAGKKMMAKKPGASTRPRPRPGGPKPKPIKRAK